MELNYAVYELDREFLPSRIVYTSEWYSDCEQYIRDNANYDVRYTILSIYSM